MIERAGVFDGIVDEMTVNKRLPGSRLMQVWCWHNGNRQHGGNRVDRHADPEDSPLQQDLQYRRQFSFDVKLRTISLALLCFSGDPGVFSAVRRLLYMCLGVAIACCSTTVRSLHWHVSVGHSHHEHDHGPASHEHQPQPPHHSDEQPANGTDLAQLSACEPATHAVFLNDSTKAVSATAIAVVATMAAAPAALVPPIARDFTRITHDPRQHSPPDGAPTSARPPPLTQAA